MPETSNTVNADQEAVSLRIAFKINFAIFLSFADPVLHLSIKAADH